MGFRERGAGWKSVFRLAEPEGGHSQDEQQEQEGACGSDDLGEAGWIAVRAGFKLRGAVHAQSIVNQERGGPDQKPGKEDVTRVMFSGNDSRRSDDETEEEAEGEEAGGCPTTSGGEEEEPDAHRKKSHAGVATGK